MNQGAQTQLLLEKWSKNINAVSKGLGKDLSQDRQVVLATCLESTQAIIDRNTELNEATQTSDIGPYKKHAFELVTAVMPNLIAQDIVSVQPLTSRVGEIRFLQYVYGNNKGKIKKGDVFADALHGTGASSTTYSSEHVEDEFLAETGATDVTGNLSWTPVRPGTLAITVNGKTIIDDGNGKVKGADLASEGTINYETGAIAFTFSSGTSEDVVATYDYDLETAPVKAPEVELRMKSLPIVARARKLKVLYSFDAAYDLQQDYGYNIGTDIIANTAAEIKHEIDGEILDDILRQAGNTVTDWSAVPPAGISLADHNASFYNTIIEASNLIFQATKRVSGSFLVVGTGVANIVESLLQYRNVATPGTVGPHLAGYLNGTMPVYKNPYYPADEYVVGYKGTGLFETGYVYSPYMPIATTSLLMAEDFTGRRGFATSYGKKMCNPMLYTRGKITHTPA